MQKKRPMFYSALLLTAVNLMLRAAGTSFQVYLSGRIGAAGIGLLQLVLSVGSLAMVAGIAGVRTAAMYLTAEELGHGQRGRVVWILSGCFGYSILCSALVASGMYRFAPEIARYWVCDLRTVGALRLFAAFLPTTCLCGVMTGYFTAAGRIGTLAAVEVAEQICSICITLAALHFWAGTDAARACQAVILGSGLGGCITLVCLIVLRLREKPPVSAQIAVKGRLFETAVPLALADILKSGINTVENLMVPKRLALNHTVRDPLAEFGRVSGMVFPVLMFPACILFGLAELLIPELARCAAAGSKRRIHYLVRRGLKISMLYGVACCGLECLLADWLCNRLYGSFEAGRYLRLYALLIPMLYCDAITDAMTKGLGQQKVCVRYNILTSFLDVVFLFLLLPKYGMTGYYASFLITHLLNFLLSLNRLMKITGRRIPMRSAVLTMVGTIGALSICLQMDSPLGRALVYPVILGCMLYLMQVVDRRDIIWLRSLVQKK